MKPGRNNNEETSKLNLKKVKLIFLNNLIGEIIWPKFIPEWEMVGT